MSSSDNVTRKTGSGEGLTNAKDEMMIPEPKVIDILWGKVATKVGTFLAKIKNLVSTFPHGPQIVKL
jgi:hypothetical protein